MESGIQKALGIVGTAGSSSSEEDSFSLGQAGLGQNLTRADNSTDHPPPTADC